MQREDALEAIESSYAAQKLWRRQTAKVHSYGNININTIQYYINIDTILILL